jgi:prepilin signal peptidase PulO-like enzyme (type II secretory pathway)
MPEWLIVLLIIVVGLAVGSFVTLLSYRLPRAEPIAGGRSRCTQCKTTLGVPALFPVLSWLWQRGRCRYCKAGVSARYPLTELTQALLFLFIYSSQGLSWPALVLALLSVALLAMTVIDFEWYILPDELQWVCAGLAIVYHWLLSTPFVDVLLGAGFGALLGASLHYGFRWLRKKDGLGWGDVKFLLVSGLWLAGLANWPAYLFIAGVMGVFTGLVWRLLGKGERFPFGPALAAALLLVLLTPVAALFFWTMDALYA